MVISHRAFLIELYEEYLAEASFLYEQRSLLYRNPEVTWRKLGEFENRLEAHIDGLVVGDKLALDVCSRHAAEGDFGELYAAMSVFCRQGRRDLVLGVFDQLDPGDPQKACAVADALKYELPEAWCPDFRTLLASGDPKLAPILARAFGYCRTQCGPELLRAMKHCAAAALTEIVWALGRIAHGPAVGQLLNCLTSEEEPVRSAAAIALAHLGEPSVIDLCLQQTGANTWPILPISLAGGRSMLAVVTELARNSDDSEFLTALGLIGDPTIVPLLISRLAQPASASAAAAALQCLTGACLYEAVFLAEDIDEDTLFESEREQLKQGKQLDRGDGRPFGSTVTRLSQNPEDWQRWWQTNAIRFTPGVRYRNGGLFSPARLIETLTDESTPHELRQYCSEELATRYRYDFGFETDMPVSCQINKLAEAVAWSKTGGAQFQEGEWYFAGHRCV
jgi:uncharacterized protein (TIGR02270 family)